MSPIGIYGSTSHVLTNKKVENKFECVKEQIKTRVKDSFKGTAAVVGTAGAAAGITAVVNNVKPSALNGLKNQYNKISDGAMSVLKKYDLTEAQKALTKFNKVPVAGKVAALVGAASLIVVGAIHQVNQVGKMGGIEGKYEVDKYEA